jgi:alpha-galactosidase
MRTDYALLARAQLHSTSDQQDPLRYPPIAVSAPLAVAPEQAAVWAYPQPEHTADEISFTLCTALLSRVHLSGFLDRMDPWQRALVVEALEVYRSIRGSIAGSVPIWPLGLPRWDDPAPVLGQRAEDGTVLVVVWRRFDGPARITLPLSGIKPGATAEILFPGSSDAEIGWDERAGALTVALPRSPQACLVRVL